jgi:hypothetical protein
MSSANEASKAALGAMFAGGGGAGSKASIAPPTSNPMGGGGSAADGTLLKDDPMFSKYFKMLKMHLPADAVKQKMSAEGLDPTILDMDPEGLSPNAPPAAAAAAAPKSLTRAQQMSKDMDDKAKASGGGGVPAMPMSQRPSAGVTMVEGYRNLGEWSMANARMNGHALDTRGRS